MLILRLVVGLLFVGHGAQKLFGLFGGGGIDGTARSFEKGGLRPGHFHAVAAGCAEFFGGLFLAVGLLTPFAAAALIAVMVAAIATVHWRNGLWVTEQGFEFNLVMIAAAFAVAGAGAGTWSLDGAFGLDVAGAGWGVGALLVGALGGAAAVITGRLYGARRGTRHPHAAPHSA